MPLSQLDEELLAKAVALARGAIGLSEPNPRVGCIVHDAAGLLAGQGFTQAAGSGHAEVMALRAAADEGKSVAGGTAWVSLEPCAHHGRTPPCCDALIAAGLARVVVAALDPFDAVAGRGVARMRTAGITVDLAPEGPTKQAAFELNIGFFSRVVRRRPWVRLKVATSLDGKTALPNGTSQWITCAESRADGHRWRHRASAILTGIGTVLADDPRLDVRDVQALHQPHRIVLDSKLSVPSTARVLQPPGRAWVVHASGTVERERDLTARGVEVSALPGANGQVDLGALLTCLADAGVNELHVEAGATLNAALLEADLVDELLIYMAPKLLGPGRDFAAMVPRTDLAGMHGFEFIDIARVGTDLRLTARPPGRAQFLVD